VERAKAPPDKAKHEASKARSSGGQRGEPPRPADPLGNQATQALLRAVLDGGRGTGSPPPPDRVADAPSPAAERGALLVSRMADGAGGNASLLRMLRAARAQAKLAGSAPDDASERDADRAADHVLASDGNRPPPSLAAAPAATPEHDVKRAAEGDGARAPASDFASRVQSMRGSGAGLPDAQRSFFEARMGRDLDGVRVHTDGRAADAAREVSAHAFTAGSDIFFASGRYAPETASGKRLLAHELAHVAQQTGAGTIRRERSSGGGALRIDRQADAHAPAAGPGPAANTANAGATTDADKAAPSRPGIVEDDQQAGEGQMTRSQFVAVLRPLVWGVAAAELAAARRSAQDCPYLSKWLDYYSGQPAASLVRVGQVYAGAAPNATGGAILGAVAGRVAQAIRQWAKSGKVETPGGANPEEPGSAPQGSAAPSSGGGSAVQTKRDGVGASSTSDAASTRARLGAGRPLDGGVRSRMENAFGGSFGDVRVHTDANARALNDRMSARAFTVGRDVAFGGNQYRPGSIAGDLLIAHELAHVVQQRGGGATAERAAGDPSLEREADRAAAAAALGQQAQLSQGRGLRLQRCNQTQPTTTDAGPTSTPSTTASAPPPAPSGALKDSIIGVPARQAAVDTVMGQISEIDPTLMEDGKMHYIETLATGKKAEGNTTPPGGVKRGGKATNKLPYVQILPDAFNDGWGWLKSSVWHEWQHVKQMTPKNKMLAPEGKGGEDVEAYSQEIIKAKENKVEPPEVETLWSRLKVDWNKLSAARKTALTPLVTQAQNAAKADYSLDLKL